MGITVVFSVQLYFPLTAVGNQKYPLGLRKALVPAQVLFLACVQFFVLVTILRGDGVLQ